MISNFASRFTVSRSRRRAADTTVEIETLTDSFAVSIPSDFHLLDDGRVVWKNSSQTERIRFQWRQMPSEVSIELPNQSRLSLTPIEVSAFDSHSPIRFAAPLLGALTFHMLAVALIVLTPSTPERAPLKISVGLIQTQSTARPTSKDRSAGAESLASVNETKQLFKSLSVGKSKKHLAQTSAPTSLDRAFAQKNEDFHKTWSVDQEIRDLNERPLNLSESQVKAALAPAYAHLKECYEDVLIRDSSLKGQPQLVIDVNQAGRVSALSLSLLKAQSGSIQALKNCFFKAYQSVRLPKPNRDFQVVHTLVLSY